MNNKTRPVLKLRALSKYESLLNLGPYYVLNTLRLKYFKMFNYLLFIMCYFSNLPQIQISIQNLTHLQRHRVLLIWKDLGPSGVLRSERSTQSVTSTQLKANS